ncbi:hypothetical protein F66182_8097 [Fusarium sp. NRRL 66182]|nr:hypothetical protein F66182_8097 [Fusarium sp. NRRL 66182]
MSALTENQGAKPPGLILTQTASTASDTHGADVQMADGSDYEPSDASSYDPAAVLLDTISQPNATSKKRRQSLDCTNLQQTKKVRLREADPSSSRESPSLVADRARQVPAEIWQHIFTFLPPRDLGRLLAVNKLFHAFLAPVSTNSFPRPNAVPSSLPILKPEAIWQASRRLFWGARMPAPLKGRSELQMWRLICSVSCQFCGSKGQKKPLTLSDQGWRSGPGPTDICPIFPFSIVTCGSCLTKKGIKEIDLLLSSSFPSFLLPALPSVFVDAEMHIIPPRVMQTGAVPPSTHVTKLFWSEHVEQIKEEFSQVKALGSAAAEEWIKGLEIRGKEALVDASRWGKWAVAGGVAQVRMSKLDEPKIEASGPAASTLKPLLKNPSPDATKQVHEQQVQTSNPNEKPGLVMQLDANSQQSRTPTQQKRTKEEVAQLKAQRRADIESRGMLLDPPLTPSVLAHIPSFQAALQLITPLDDTAWELLKPRLLAQWPEAELRAKQSNADAQALQDKVVKKEGETNPSREPREVPDQEWDDVQGPVRARISEYADEIIQGWNNGAKLKKKNCPQYAADVLLYVRKRFYAEIAKDTAAVVAAGKQPIIEPPEGPWTQKLTLENMKWVFDTKVKPRTEPMRKELFLCNGCLGGNGILKFFGFEGVLQHYAAKHTTSLSLGNVVVHWRAEWPDVPPFSPDPRNKEKAYYDNDSSHSLPPREPPNQLAYPGFQAGPPTGYAPPIYGAEAPGPLLPHYNSGPSLPIPHATSYSQAGVHAYGVPYTSTPYQSAAAYSSYHPPFSSEMAYSSHDQSNGYTLASVSAPATFDYRPYPAHRNANDGVSTDKSYQAKLDTIAQTVNYVWSRVGINKRLPPSVRAYVAFHHVARAFEETHHENAPLLMFIDALANHKKLRQMRMLNGVQCKACADNPTFHLPQLAKHFRKEHVDIPQTQGLPPMDWRVDMIKLPEEERLAVLKDKLGENASAYSLVVDAIPWAFEQAFIAKFAQAPLPAKSQGVPPVKESYKLPFQASSETANDYAKEARTPANIPQTKDPVQELDHGHPRGQPRVEGLLDTSISQAQLHWEYGKDIPHLRPASEVYGRRKHCPPAVQENLASRYHDYSPSSFERVQELIRRSDQGGTKVKTEYEPVIRPPPGPVQPQNGSHWRDEWALDYRDAREQRYSGAEPTKPRDRSASVGNRPREYHPLKTTSVHAAPGYIEVGPREGDVPPIVSYNHHIVKEEVVYVDESGREIGRGIRARDSLPQESRYSVPEDRTFGQYHHHHHHHHLSSSWYDGHGPVRYRERSPRPRHATPGYHYDLEPAPHPMYHDHPNTRPPTEHPAGAYELVEVRHPDGDYFIRRPIRCDDRPYYYDTRRSLREQSVYPSQRVTEGYSGARVGDYAFDARQKPAMPGQPASRPDYDNYDPQYPPITTGEPAAYDGNRR